MTAANLPEQSYAYHPTTGATIMVKRGEKGFWAMTTDATPELLNKVATSRHSKPRQCSPARCLDGTRPWLIPPSSPRPTQS